MPRTSQPEKTRALPEFVPLLSSKGAPTITSSKPAPFTFPVPPGGFSNGNHDVVITNPAPADCSDTVAFGVAPAPTVSDAQPPKVCSEGDIFIVTGTGFVAGSQILLDADCWRIRWFCGVPSLDEHRRPKTVMVAIIIPGHLRCGWPVAVSAAD